MYLSVRETNHLILKLLITIASTKQYQPGNEGSREHRELHAIGNEQENVRCL